MHGDRNKTEYAPDGRTSETIFAIHGFSPGIRQGIVTTLAVKTGKENEPKMVRFRNDIDAAKAADRREQLLETLNDPEFDSRYELANPEPFNRYSFRPRQVAAEFKAWPTLQDIAAVPPVNGLMEKRGGVLMHVSRPRLQERMKIYFDASLDWAAFKSQGSLLGKDAARFDAEKTRKRLIHLEGFKPKQIVRYWARPFDFQWCYYSGIRPLWNEPRPQLWDWSRIAGNKYLVSRQVRGATPEGPPFYFLTCIGDDHALRTDAYFFPMRAHENSGGHSSGALFAKAEITNLSPRMRAYMENIGFTDPDGDENCYSSPWWHALAIGFSPKYLAEHSEGIAIGWPRIPMPRGRSDFDHSAALGKRLSDLLDIDVNVAEITSGTIAEHHKIFGVLSAADLVVRGWGHPDTKGRVNPGKGRVDKREYSASESEAIRQGAQASGIDEARAFELLGSPVDIYLNGTTCWRCVPTAVWEYFIGGYQVVKKWLSYRDESIFGRPLTKDEAREVTSMIRRISAIVLLTDALDANYVRAKETAQPWLADNTASK